MFKQKSQEALSQIEDMENQLNVLLKQLEAEVGFSEEPDFNNTL